MRKKEVVKYQNSMNTATIRTWTEREMDIFFSIVAKIRDKSTKNMIFSFEELRNLTNFKSNISKKEFVNELVNVSKKLSSLNYLERSADGMNAKLFILFQTFDIRGNEETLTVSVHHEFEYVFNRIGMEFTQFELEEFLDVSSTYAKTAYRLLKQYRTTGFWKVTLEDFKLLLDIPKSYRPSNIDQQIIKPILEQLGGENDSAIFQNLRVVKNKKAGRGRGGVLTGYTFLFDKETTEKWIDGKYEKKKPSVRKETLPKWAEDGYIQPKTVEDNEVAEQLAKRLAEYEKNKQEKSPVS